MLNIVYIYLIYTQGSVLSQFKNLKHKQIMFAFCINN